MNLDRLKTLSGADTKTQQLKQLVVERDQINAAYDKAISDLQRGQQLDESLSSALGAALMTLGKLGAKGVSELGSKIAAVATNYAKKAGAAVKEVYLDQKAKLELKRFQKGMKYIISDFANIERDIPTLISRDKEIAALMEAYKKHFEQTLGLLAARMELKEELDAEEVEGEELYDNVRYDAVPAPENSTEEFVTGWKYGNWWLQHGGPVEVKELPDRWGQEKAEGFKARLAKARGETQES